MVKTEVITAFVLTLALLCSCQRGFTYSWQSYTMDAHRTGVTAPNADNFVEALGIINDSSYIAPNGRVFPKGTATYAAARDMIEVQPEMADLKKVIGYSVKEMRRFGPECELSNWTIDHLMADVARLTGKKVDVGITNLGGIRTDMPKGDIIMDDIVSMFPFNNYLVYLGLKGSDLQAVFDQMAERHVQPLGGVKLVIDDHKIDTLLIGGKPLDPNRVYGVATIDFLLDGGDNFHLAKNCKEMIITKTKIIDSMLPYVLSYNGKPIDSQLDGRVVVRKKEDRQ